MTVERIAMSSNSAVEKTIKRIKQYTFGINGIICLNTFAVLLTDTDKPKTIVLPLKRWMKLARIFQEIYQVLLSFMRGEQVDYMKHIGGGFHVSIATPYCCVNIRKFVQSAPGKAIRPTKQGIAVRFIDWHSFIDANRALVNENLHLKGIKECESHSGQLIESESAMQWQQNACPECYPYIDVPPSVKSIEERQEFERV